MVADTLDNVCGFPFLNSIEGNTHTDPHPLSPSFSRREEADNELPETSITTLMGK